MPKSYRKVAQKNIHAKNPEEVRYCFPSLATIFEFYFKINELIEEVILVLVTVLGNLVFQRQG